MRTGMRTETFVLLLVFAIGMFVWLAWVTTPKSERKWPWEWTWPRPFWIPGMWKGFWNKTNGIIAAVTIVLAGVSFYLEGC